MVLRTPAERGIVIQHRNKLLTAHRSESDWVLAVVVILGMVKLVDDAVSEAGGGNSKPFLVPFADVGQGRGRGGCCRCLFSRNGRSLRAHRFVKKVKLFLVERGFGGGGMGVSLTLERS